MILSFLILHSAGKFVNDKDMRIWFDKPSSKLPLRSEGILKGSTNAHNVWEQNTLPIGNGDIGANIYGEIAEEHITFNEKTLWTGGPSKKRPNYMGGNVEENGRNGSLAKEIQDLFEAGKDDEAWKKCDKMTGTRDGIGYYQFFSDIFLTLHSDEKEATDFVRYLDLDTGIAAVNYQIGDTKYFREFFVSHPHNVLVLHLYKEGPANINVEIKPVPAHKSNLTITIDGYDISGELDDNQELYNGYMRVVKDGGTATTTSNSIKIENTNEVFMYMSAATDYKQEYPKYRTGENIGDIQKRVKQIVDKAVESGFDAVKKEHLADFTSMFSRTKLDIGQKPSDVPFNQLLDLYKNGKMSEEQGRVMEAVMFQYGRYLLMGSSRADSQLPANLQGVWNDQNDPAWQSDYHMNINLQMNYWLAPITDLAECQLPLFEYIEGLRKPGRLTTTIYTGINETEDIKEYGFMIHIANTPFGFTAPGTLFKWAWEPGTAPWILTNLYDYYEFTKDETILRNKLYPLLKEETIFYQRFAKPENQTARKLIISPASSPEQEPRTNGCAFENHMMWKLFNITILTAEKFGLDKDKIEGWKSTMSQIRGPIEIGESGQIKEWHNEGKLGSMGEKNHRHMSHLLSFYPLDMITIDTPDYLAATVVSLIDRGDLATGWATTQRVCSWARVGDGEKSFTILQKFIKNRIYSNLFDFCPPFQIDGNFGVTAGIAEMLLQSHLGSILLLPALPKAWSTGSFNGLIGRGNFQFNVTWANMKLKSVSVKSRSGNKLRLRYPGISRATPSSNANIKKINEDEIEFDTEINGVYTFTNFIEPERSNGPQSISTKRISNNQVFISWNQIEKAESYKVYRQIGEIKPLLIAKDVKSNSFIDNNNFLDTDVPSSQYYVSAVISGIETHKSIMLGSKEPYQVMKHKNHSTPQKMDRTTQKLYVILIYMIAGVVVCVLAIALATFRKLSNDENGYEPIDTKI